MVMTVDCVSPRETVNLQLASLPQLGGAVCERLGTSWRASSTSERADAAIPCVMNFCVIIQYIRDYHAGDTISPINCIFRGKFLSNLEMLATMLVPGVACRYPSQPDPGYTLEAGNPELIGLGPNALRPRSFQASAGGSGARHRQATSRANLEREARESYLSEQIVGQPFLPVRQ